MTYPALLKRYLDHLNAGNYSPCTIKHYGDDIKKMTDYLLNEKGIKRVQDVDKDVLKEYQSLIFSQKRIRDGKPLSLSMKSLKIVAIKSFFGFLTKKGDILYNPSSELDVPKRRRDILRDVLKENEIIRLLEAAKGKTPLEIRDRAILELFYSTGIRNTELRELVLGDIDLMRQEIRIRHGKGYFGEKERLLPVGRMAVSWIEEYLKNARVYLRRHDQSNHLFVSFTGKKLSIETPDDIVKKYARLAKIKKNVRAHMMRHSFATHLLRHGADIRHVQAFLGHESLDSTKIYTKVEISDLKRIHHKTHPREKP